MDENRTISQCYQIAKDSCHGHTVKHAIIVASRESWLRLARRTHLDNFATQLALVKGEFTVQIFHDVNFKEGDVPEGECCVKLLPHMDGDYLRIIAIEKNECPT